jgi:CMP-N,N'-diacetyllegionaminic acid synthase
LESKIKVLGLITARGGSKGIPGKNIKLLAGKPLLEYTAEAALAATRLAKVILSTDDEAIAALGRKTGLDVPFLRPVELAQDDTPTLPVVQHALEWCEKHGEKFDAVCLLQPTSPLRTPGTIDACIELFKKSGADSVVTILPVPDEYNPHWVYFKGVDGFLRLSTGEFTPIPRRQALTPAFHREGSVYITRRDVVMEQGSLYGQKVVGYQMEADQSVNLDTPADWERAERMLKGSI